MCSEGREVRTAKELADDLFRVRLDYAWKWFEYHAKQRVSMFNFFLIATGLLATAYVNSLCKGEVILSASLSFFGALVAFAFILLDYRNARLVYLGEDVLRRLEADDLFVDFRGLDERLKDVEGGIVHRDAAKPQHCWMRHKCLLKAIEAIVVIGFLLGTLYAVV